MSEMVKRVAKAIWENDGLMFHPSSVHNLSETQARAVIASMRDPTPEMVAKVVRQTHPASHAISDWQAMIDEAQK